MKNVFIKCKETNIITKNSIQFIPFGDKRCKETVYMFRSKDRVSYTVLVVYGTHLT